MRTTPSITTTKLGSRIPQIMLISWQHFRQILLETFILVFCSPKISDVFSRLTTTGAISHKWMVQLTWKEVKVHLLDARQTIWPWPLTWSMTLTLDFSMSNFEIAVSCELLVWLMSNGKEVNQLNNRLTIWPCPLTTLMTLTLKFQGQSLK